MAVWLRVGFPVLCAAVQTWWVVVGAWGPRLPILGSSRTKPCDVGGDLY